MGEEEEERLMIAELRSQVQRSAQMGLALLEENKNLRLESQQAKKERDEALEDLHSAQHRLHSHKMVEAEYSEQLEALNSSLNRAKAGQGELQEAKALREQLKLVGDRAKAAEEAASDSRARLERAEKEAEQLRAQLESLRNHCRRSSEESSNTTTILHEVETLRDELSKTQEQRDSLQQELHHCQGREEQIKDDLAQSQRQYEEAKELLAESKAEACDLREALRAAEAETAVLRCPNANRGKKGNSLFGEVEEHRLAMQTEAKRLRRDLDKSVAALAKLEEEKSRLEVERDRALAVIAGGTGGGRANDRLVNQTWKERVQLSLDLQKSHDEIARLLKEFTAVLQDKKSPSDLEPSEWLQRERLKENEALRDEVKMLRKRVDEKIWMEDYALAKKLDRRVAELDRRELELDFRQRLVFQNSKGVAESPTQTPSETERAGDSLSAAEAESRQAALTSPPQDASLPPATKKAVTFSSETKKEEENDKENEKPQRRGRRAGKKVDTNQLQWFNLAESPSND